MEMKATTGRNINDHCEPLQAGARDRTALIVPEGPRGEKYPADVVGCAVCVAKIATGEVNDTVCKMPNRARVERASARAPTNP